MTFWFGKAKQMWYLTDFSSSDRLTPQARKSFIDLYAQKSDILRCQYNAFCWKIELIHTHNNTKIGKTSTLKTSLQYPQCATYLVIVVSSNKFSLLINDTWVKCYKHVIYSKTVDTENIKQHKSRVESCSKRQRESTMLMNSQTTIWYSWNENNFVQKKKTTYEWNGKLLLALKCIVSNLYPFFSLFFFWLDVNQSIFPKCCLFFLFLEWLIFLVCLDLDSTFISCFDGLPLERLMFYRWLLLNNYCHNLCDTLAHFALFHTHKFHSSFKFSTHYIVFFFFFSSVEWIQQQHNRHRTLYSWCETYTDSAIVSTQ